VQEEKNRKVGKSFSNFLVCSWQEPKVSWALSRLIKNFQQNI